MYHELSITRLIDAPRDAVWRAWTEHLEEWFCPRPWSVGEHELDLRPGGIFRTVMLGPDGERMDLMGVVLEVVPGERIVTTDAYRPGWEPAEKPFFTGITTFADEDGRTRYTARALHWREEDKKAHEAMGFEQGWGQVAAQLEDVAKRIAG